jgi:F0F1-type ATP synthase assembly protein I
VGLGAELVAPILLGAFVGAFLDARFGVEPWLTVVGSILGVVSGMASFLRRVLPRRDGPQGGT